MASTDVLESSLESIPEDDELEVSCALQKLTMKVHSFRSKMNMTVDETPEEVIDEEIQGLPPPATTPISMLLPPPPPSLLLDPTEELDAMKHRIDHLLMGMKTQLAQLKKA